MKTFATATIVFAAMVAGDTVSAQVTEFSTGGVPTTTGVVGYYGGGYYPACGYGSSTIAEGYFRGAADLVRAYGDNAYMTSLGAINVEIARQKLIENRERWVDTYFQMRRQNQAFRVAQRGPVPTLAQAQALARAAAPQRLNTYQLEPVTGRIYWPAALQGKEFAMARKQLDALFSDRDVHNTGVGSSTDAAVRAIAEQMREQLKSQITAMSPSEYVAARTFIDSLAYEARFAPGVEGIAAK